jgi:DNA polymerase-1
MIKKHLLNLKCNAVDTVMIVDGKYLVYRTQYSKNVSSLSHGGIKTGVYYGFFNTIRSLVTKFYPTNMVITWDGVGSVRRKEYSGYKNRENLKYMKPEQIGFLNEIADEYPKIVALCGSLGFAGYILDGYEADDLIALFVNRFKNINKIIITRDEDMYQCIDKNTIIYDPDRKLKKDLNWFKRTYNIEPEQWALVKAYGGCKSDTVPGIPGVAEMTAIKIIKKDPKAIKKLESADKDKIELWKRLTVLPHPNLKNVHIPYKMTHLNMDLFIDMCMNFNFRSFLERINEFEYLQ